MEDISSLYEDLMESSSRFPDRGSKSFEDLHRKCSKLQKEQDMLVITLTQMADENKRLVKERDNFVAEQSNIIQEKEVMVKNFKLLATACRKEIKKLRSKIDLLTKKGLPNQTSVSDSAEDTEDKYPSNPLDTMELTNELKYSTLLKVIYANSPSKCSSNEKNVKKRPPNQVFDCRPFNGPKTPPTPGGTENRSHRTKLNKDLSYDVKTTDDDRENISENCNVSRSSGYKIPLVRGSENDFLEFVPSYSTNAPANEMMEYLDRHKDKFEMFRSWFSKYNNDNKQRHLDSSKNKKETQEFKRSYDDYYQENDNQVGHSSRSREEFALSRYRSYNDHNRFDDKQDYSGSSWKTWQCGSGTKAYNEYIDRSSSYQGKWLQGNNKWYGQNRNYRANPYQSSRQKYGEVETSYDPKTEEKEYRQGATRATDQEDLDFYKELWNRHKRELAKLGSNSISTDNFKTHNSFRDSYNSSEPYNQASKRNFHHTQEVHHGSSRCSSNLQYSHYSSSTAYADRTNYRNSDYYREENRSSNVSGFEKDRRTYTKPNHYQYTSRHAQHSNVYEEDSYSERRRQRHDSRERRSIATAASPTVYEEEAQPERKLVTSVVVLPERSSHISCGVSEKSVDVTSQKSSGPTEINDQESLRYHRIDRQGITKHSPHQSSHNAEETSSMHKKRSNSEQSNSVQNSRKNRTRREGSWESCDRLSDQSSERYGPVSPVCISPKASYIDNEIEEEDEDIKVVMKRNEKDLKKKRSSRHRSRNQDCNVAEIDEEDDESPIRSRSDSFSPRVTSRRVSLQAPDEQEDKKEEITDHEGVSDDQTEEDDDLERSPEMEDPQVNIDRDLDWHGDSETESQIINENFCESIEKTERDLFEEGEIADSAGEDGESGEKNKKKIIELISTETRTSTRKKEGVNESCKIESGEHVRSRPQICRSSKVGASLRARLGCRPYSASTSTSLLKRSNHLGVRFSAPSQRSFTLNRRGRLPGSALSAIMRKHSALDNRFRQNGRILAYRRQRLN